SMSLYEFIQSATGEPYIERYVNDTVTRGESMTEKEAHAKSEGSEREGAAQEGHDQEFSNVTCRRKMKQRANQRDAVEFDLSAADLDEDKPPKDGKTGVAGATSITAEDAAKEHADTTNDSIFNGIVEEAADVFLWATNNRNDTWQHMMAYREKTGDMIHANSEIRRGPSMKGDKRMSINTTRNIVSYLKTELAHIELVVKKRMME
ncbi:hypothetical protein PFISCL1PPCAC_16533, partial [Pristionchus fissidentatus]